jgi:actin-related protein
MPERMKLEVEKIIHRTSPTLKVKCIAAGTNERSLCSWLGGSLLASLGAFHEMWLSKEEYKEFGPSIIDRKLP